MEFCPIDIDGALGIRGTRNIDERGYFDRFWELNEACDLKIRQASIASNPSAGTLRGMHFQKEPKAEFKIIHCIAGAVYDVLIDLRPNSRTFRKTVELSLSWDEEFQGLMIPPGVAHGYMTLIDDTSLVYLMDTEYSQVAAAGVRWNDPKLSISWPSIPSIISERDLGWPDIEW